MSEQQFQYVQTDERNRFTTMLRPMRINQGSAPINPKTQPKIDHPARIIFIENEKELIDTTNDYEVYFDAGDIAIMSDTSTARTKLFVFIGPGLGWQEIVLGSNLDSNNVTYFKSNIDIAEKGAVLHNLYFEWDLKTDAPYQSIDDIGELPAGIRNKTFHDLNIFEDTVFTFRASDGRVSSKEECSIHFRDRIYYGTSFKESLIEEEIKELNSLLLKDFKTRFNFTARDEYIYIAIPKDMGVPEFIASELYYNSWEKDNLEMTNKYGYKAMYDIYRTTYSQECKDLVITII